MIKIVFMCFFVGITVAAIRHNEEDANHRGERAILTVFKNKIQIANRSVEDQIINYVQETVLGPILCIIANDLNTIMETVDILDNNTLYVDMLLYYNRTIENDFKKATSVTSIWPYYQMTHCIIYSNSRKVPAHEMITYTLGTAGYIMTIVPLYVSWAYHYLILRFRENKTNFEAITRGLVYSIQKHVNSSIPTLDKYRHSRIFLATMYFYIFVTVFMYLSYFATQCTIPTYRASMDLDMPALEMAGVGEFCLKEIMRGKYLKRICLVSCSLAKSLKHKKSFAISEIEIDFGNTFLMNTQSVYYNQTKNLLSTYASAGIIEQVFQIVQLNSHRHLTQSLGDQTVNLNELKGLIINTLLVGSIVSTIVFCIELIYAKVKRH